MSLPWIKPKQVAGLIVSRRKPDDSQEVTPESESPVLYCAEEILKAVSANDAKALAMALEHAFNILDSAEEDQEPQENE